MLLLLIIIAYINFLFPQDCITADCHSEMDGFSRLHVPVEEGECSSCHSKNEKTHPDSNGPEFSLEESDMYDLCTSCHEIEITDDTHMPVAEGMCITCHDPHGSNNDFLLKAEDISVLCSECHDIAINEDKFIHGPVAVGACSICHSAHGDMQNSLLQEDEINNVCFGCHESKSAEINSFFNIHTPVEESCTLCHNPHSSNYKYMLNSETKDLCFDCHGEIESLVEDVVSDHQALVIDNKCLNCHDSHGSDFQFNLKDETYDLCMKCHNKPVKSDTKMLTDMKKLLSDNSDWHGPIRDQECSGCHNPHGSENIRLLRHYYPPEFYSAFDVDNYQLCFQCHPETNVTDETTASSTNFRDGNRNLHYLHVNQKKGRTCRACHQVHASDHSYHIRDGVPFGKWVLPINFEIEDNGGTCSPGCHPKVTYNRKK